MVQLSLLDTEPLTLQALLPQLARRWGSRLGAPVQAEQARRIVLSRFHGWSGRPLSKAESDRVAAYFGGVVRRSLTRPGDRQAAEARRTLVRASIEADLREAGWSRERAAAEALRVCGMEPALGGAA